MSTLATGIVVAGIIAVYAFALAICRAAGEADARTERVWQNVRAEIERRDRLTECDVYADAPDRTERMIGLYVADRELRTAATRVGIELTQDDGEVAA